MVEAAWGWHRSPLSFSPHGGGVAGLPVALEEAFPPGRRRPSTADCEERFFTQTLDHFRHVPAAAAAGGAEDERQEGTEHGHPDENTFQQRYFLCGEFWGQANGDDGGTTTATTADIQDGDGDRNQGEGNKGAGPGSASTKSGGGGGASRGADNAAPGARGPIFFYTGNEADVSLYLGATGLMWENAPDFRALLVFAEHRFYGESLPFGAPDKGREFLSTSQALADYACLITALKKDLGAEESPVVAFGGSYGGMLASWFRLKYPHIVHGAIAASAPVLALEGLTRPAPDPEAFAATVTRAAGPAGGAAGSCADNVRRAFSAVLSPSSSGDDRPSVGTGTRGGDRDGGEGNFVGVDAVGSSVDGGDAETKVVGGQRDRAGGGAVLRGAGVGFGGDAEEGSVVSSWRQEKQRLVPPGETFSAEAAAATAAADVARRLRVCPGREPQGEDALVELAWWARAAFDYLAMGNFPYATGYILNSGDGGVELPPWPLREACSYLADPSLQAEDDDVLLGALADAIGVYYNATGEVECFSPAAGANNESSVDGDNWNWQACTEMSMPMSTDGKRDMFWPSEWDPVAQAAQCMEQYGVSPRDGWGAAEYGGYDSWSQVTNVVFSNGRLDPWSGMGVVDQRRAGAGVKVIMMDQAAHHLDLFFEHPLDPPDVVEARRVEMAMVEGWVDQAYRAYGGADSSSIQFGSDESNGVDGASSSSSRDACVGDECGPDAHHTGESSRESAQERSWLEHVPSLTADW
ncbi:unnamed protein product [Scytosiphon promiscuus]